MTRLTDIPLGLHKADRIGATTVTPVFNTIVGMKYYVTDIRTGEKLYESDIRGNPLNKR